MAHPLDGARLKVIRAKEHLKSFNEEAWRYVNTEPYKIVPALDGDVIGIRGIITPEPPPSLACIVGDFVTNLRAALDYIAWELARLEPAFNLLTDGQRSKIAFPVAEDYPSFSKKDRAADRLQRTCKVPASTIAIIESVQPYHAGYKPLDSLNLLVNRDKHRALLLCAGFMESAGRFSVYRGDKLHWTAFGAPSAGPKFTASGPALPTLVDFRVEVNEKPTIFIALKDFPSPPEFRFVGILEDILECVANVVKRFDPLFP